MNLETLQTEHKKYKQLLDEYIEFSTFRYKDIKNYEDILIQHYKINTYDKLIDICYMDINNMELLGRYNNLYYLSGKLIELIKIEHQIGIKTYENKGLLFDNQKLEYYTFLTKYEDIKRLLYVYSKETMDTIHYTLLTSLKHHLSNTINKNEFIIISEALEHIVKYTKQIDKINLINSVTSKGANDTDTGKRKPLVNALDTIIPYCKNANKINTYKELYTIKNEIYQTFTSKGYSVDYNKNIENYITYDDVQDKEYFTHRYTNGTLKKDIALSLIKYFNEYAKINDNTYRISSKQDNKIDNIAKDITKVLTSLTYTIQS